MDQGRDKLNVCVRRTSQAQFCGSSASSLEPSDSWAISSVPTAGTSPNVDQHEYALLWRVGRPELHFMAAWADVQSQTGSSWTPRPDALLAVLRVGQAEVRSLGGNRRSVEQHLASHSRLGKLEGHPHPNPPATRSGTHETASSPSAARQTLGQIRLAPRTDGTVGLAPPLGDETAYRRACPTTGVPPTIFTGLSNSIVAGPASSRKVVLPGCPARHLIAASHGIGSGNASSGQTSSTSTSWPQSGWENFEP